MMKCFYTDKPRGTFFAVYSDLSGADLFSEIEDDKFVCFNDAAADHDYVDENWFIDAGYLWFFNINDKFARLANKGGLK